MDQATPLGRGVLFICSRVVSRSFSATESPMSRALGYFGELKQNLAGVVEQYPMVEGGAKAC